MQGTYLGGYPWKDTGILTAADLNAAIGVATELAGDAVQRTGDTMTGALVINLNAAPATPPGGGTVLHLKGIDGATEHIYINAYSAGTFGAAPNIQFAAAAGTGAAPAPLHSGDFLGSLSYAGYWRSAAGASGWSTNRVALNAFALDNFSDTAQGTQLQVKATPPGSTSLTTVLTISPGLQVGAPTLGDRGAGSINAQAIYIQGQAVGAATGAVPIVGGTMTGPLVINLNAAPAVPPAGGTVLHLKGVDGATEHIYINAYSTGILGAAPNITLAAARGTGAAPAALQSGDFLGALSFQGYGATGWSGNRVAVNAYALENWDHSGVNNTAQGTQLQIRTTPIGSTTLTTRLTIGPGLQVGAPASGDMGVGMINAQGIYIQGVAVAAGGLGGAVPITGGTMTGMLGVNFNAASLAVTGLGIPLVHTAGADNNPGMIIMDAYTTSGNIPTLNFRTAGGTGTAPTTIPSTGYLGGLRFFGYDATAGSFEHGTAALIRAAVNGPWSSTSHPTRFDFSVAQPGATGYPTSPVSMMLAQGLVVGGPSGGDQGFGAINAQAVYVNGAAVAFDAVAHTGDTMTGPLVINLNAAPATPPAGGTILHLKGVDGATEHIYINAYSTGIFGAAPNITLAAARGMGIAPAGLQAGDFLGALSFQGYWQSALGAGGWSTNRAGINAFALENWSDTAQGSQVQIKTTPHGAVSMVTSLTVGPGVQVGTPTGGDLGPGMINAQGIYVQGVAIAAGGLGGAVPLTGGTMTGALVVNLNAAAAQAPQAGTAMQISGLDNAVARLEIDAYNGGVAGNSPSVLLRTARGTNAPTPAFSPMLQGDFLGGIAVRGYGASGYSASNRATINWLASENWGSGSTGVSGTGEGIQMSISTTALGTTTLTARIQVGPLGGIVIGTPAGGTGPMTGDMGPGTINISTGGLYVNGVAH
jgi:hypothetical protein